MKITKVNNKTTVSLTKEEWLKIGKRFKKTAQSTMSPPSFGVPGGGGAGAGSGGGSASNPTGGAGAAGAAQQTQNQNIIGDLNAQKKTFENQKAALTSKTQSLKDAYDKAAQAAEVAKQAYDANTEGIKRVDLQIQQIDQAISQSKAPTTKAI